jgi:hypothetical protein
MKINVLSSFPDQKTMSRLIKKIDQLEEGRKPYLALANLSAPQLAFKPSDAQWSLTEVCGHLFLSEKLTVRYLRQFDFHKTNEKLGVNAFLRGLLLRRALRSNKKFKAPEVVRAKMEETRFDDFSALQSQWDLVRMDLRDYVQNFPAKHHNSFVFKHPRAGKLNIFQTLNFLIDHQKHHVNQLHEILHAKNFPLS